MHAIDLAIIVLYLVAVVGAGFYFGRRQTSTARYFLGGKEVPWWAISASIVGTETSTVTFISVPGIAYAAGGDFRFLQVVFGYVVARVVISIFFMPRYFRGELVTVYQLLQERFGGAVKGLAASLFMVMRTAADGVRLLLTAFVLAAVFKSLGFGETAVSTSIIVIGVVMILFTLIGGIEAVVWIEVIQLIIYLAGAAAAAVVLAGLIPGGLGGAIEVAAAHEKFRLLDFTFDMTRTFTFWSGVIGGAFLTMSTHGTDQYMVQRYLCTDRPQKAAAALLVSGVIVLVQFIGFLFIGILLFAFYRPDRLAEYGAAMPAAPFLAPDQVFPAFITNHLPAGLSGLVVAAIFAAAFSSSLNAIASTFVADLYAPIARNRTDGHYLNVGRVVTVVAGIAQIAVGVGMQHSARSALNIVLSIASLVNGPILGVFLLGWIRSSANRTAAFAGMLAGIVVILWVAFATPVAWPWYTIIGSMTTLAVGAVIPSDSGSRREK
ncbi:MAG TPA: sodium:solute symporter [Thermoanaerobaculia bacterium]|nr:sodium:solute symporter [Thermoanaerobaculia bacterium]